MVDPDSNQLATAHCPQQRSEVFIEGSQPTDFCLVHSLQHVSQGARLGFLVNPFATGASAAQPDGATATDRSSPPASSAARPVASAKPQAAEANAPPADRKKKGVFGKIFGVFTGGDKEKEGKKEKDKPR